MWIMIINVFLRNMIYNFWVFFCIDSMLMYCRESKNSISILFDHPLEVPYRCGMVPSGLEEARRAFSLRCHLLGFPWISRSNISGKD